jgi:hypothetical protein
MDARLTSLPFKIDAAGGWTIALTIALTFLMFVGVLVFIGQLPFMVLALYVVLSVESVENG